MSARHDRLGRAARPSSVTAIAARPATVPPARPAAGPGPQAAPSAAMPAAAPAPAPPADWAQTPERSNAFAIRLMVAIALAGGRTLARALLVPVTAYFLLAAAGPRRQARRYLGRALGRTAGWRDLWRQFFAFSAVLLDRIYLLRRRLDLFDLRLEGRALIDAVVAEGRGAFLVGAHVGSFEALSAVGRQVGGLRVAMVMYPDNARMIAAALAAVAPDARPDIIALGRAESMLVLRDWLDGGGLAGMLADRALPGASARVGRVMLPFLGREATFNDGPFRLAALLRRRVVFMAGVYEGGRRYRLRFDEVADFRRREPDPAARERRIREAVAAYVARLEALCRAHPYNWFNFHDFWSEDAA